MDDNKITYDLDSVEIFRAGTWNGDTYTEQDLDEIVKAHAEIGAVVKPFLKLGHDPNQALLQKDGYPAAGWITNVKRDGERLFADIKSIPEKIYTLIKNKAYGRFSSEIFWGLQHDGKKYPRALKAVALLGATTPAIGTMDDFINLYTEESFDYIKFYNDEEKKVEDVKIYTERIADLSEKIEQFSRDMDSLKSENAKLKDEKSKMEADNAAKEYAQHEANVKAYLDKQLEAGKIVPAQIKDFMALAMNLHTHEYSFIENNVPQKVTGAGFDLVKSILDNSPVSVDFGTKSKHQEIERKTYSKESDNPHDDLDAKIRAYADEHKVSYTDAYNVIALQSKEV